MSEDSVVKDFEPGTDAEKQLAHEHGLLLASRATVLATEPIDSRFTTLASNEEVAENTLSRQLSHALSHTTSTLRPPVSVTEGSSEEPIYVEFEADDPRDPFNFSKARKWLITIVACAYTGFVSTNSSTYAIGYGSMIRDLHATELQASAGLTTYTIGFAIAPLALASLSEEFGRRPMYLVTCGMFAIFFIPTALAKNIATVIIARFFQGAAASTGATMVGGTIADIFRTHERGIPMGFYALSAVLGVGLGPIMAGWIEQDPRFEWRWIQWFSLIFSGLLTVVIYFFMNETRGTILLARLAGQLRKESGDKRYRARVEDERASLRQLIYISCTRPIWLLMTEPIVLSFSVWLGFVWGVLYALIESISFVFGTLYPELSIGQLGSMFTTLALGSILGFLTNFIQDRVYKAKVATQGPEARLYAACAGGILTALGSFIYAWTGISGHNIPWIAPAIGVTVLTVGLFHVYLAVFNYLADAYLIYASSALSGQSFLRNMIAAAFPLFTHQMYNNLTFQWASTLIAFISVLLTAVPFVLFAWGPEIRARSRFAKQLAVLHANR